MTQTTVHYLHHTGHIEEVEVDNGIAWLNLNDYNKGRFKGRGVLFLVSFKLSILVDVFKLKTPIGFTFPITDNMIPGSMR